MSAPIGPYSPILRAGEFLITSGQLGLVPLPDGGSGLVAGGTGAQLTQALQNADTLLASEGASRFDVVKATVFLVDMADFGEMNDVWTAFFGEHRPTRSAVGVAALPLGAAVEIELWARAT